MSAEGQLLRDLLGLGLLQPRATLDRTLSALREIGAAPAAGILARHKVRRIARKRIATALADCDPATAVELRRLEAELAAVQTAQLDRGIAGVDDLLRQLRACVPDLYVLLMKGLAIRGWYPSDLPRDVGDADLWLPDPDSGWLLAGALRGLGYEYEPGEMPWLKRDADGALFGQIRLIHPGPDMVDVDIHIGPYSVRYCGLVIFARSGDRSGGRSSWGSLAPEDIVCSVIGNAAGDCFVDAKTVNDLVLAAGRGLDLDYVAGVFAATELSGFVNAVVDHAFAVCDLRPDQSDALLRLRRSVPAEELPLAAVADRDRRTRLVTAHARRMGERLTGDPVFAERIAAESSQAYGDPRSFRMRMSGGAPMRMPSMNPWTCVRLAPQPLVRRLTGRAALAPVESAHQVGLTDHLAVVETPAGDLVRFGDDVFLPTTDYLFCRRLVESQLVSATAAR